VKQRKYICMSRMEMETYQALKYHHYNGCGIDEVENVYLEIWVMVMVHFGSDLMQREDEVEK
jgi:hypothetical protein